MNDYLKKYWSIFASCTLYFITIALGLVVVNEKLDTIIDLLTKIAG